MWWTRGDFNLKVKLQCLFDPLGRFDVWASAAKLSRHVVHVIWICDFTRRKQLDFSSAEIYGSITSESDS